MKTQCVAIHDRALDAFGRPFYVQTIGQAVRSFQDELNRAHDENNLYKHPEDFDLYHLGEYDDQTGQHTNNEEPTQIAIGKHLKQGA